MFMNIVMYMYSVHDVFKLFTSLELRHLVCVLAVWHFPLVGFKVGQLLSEFKFGPDWQVC